MTYDVPSYIGEFIGTFMLVFTVGCNVLTGSATWAVTSIACVLMVCIYALGGVCGANFNPAVSVALGLSNKGVGPKCQGWPQVGIYCGVQIAAGIIAGLLYQLLFHDKSGSFNLAPTPGFSWWQAGLVELIYTFMLCFVVLNVATSLKHAGQNEFYGLAIGFVIIAGGYGGGHISGGAFNPAVAIGIDLSSAHLGFGWCVVYTLFELAGAALASALFRVVRPGDVEGTVTQDYPLSAKLVSEFLGTYILVLTVGLNVLGGSPAPVWSIAASLMCMIYALGSVSGAHFNPAVTTAILASGREKISAAHAGAYVGSQVIGGILAAFTYAVLEKDTFPLGPSEHYKGWQACICEFIFTFLLAFVVLSVATTKNGCKEMFGLAIGSCVTVGGYAIGAVSGGSLNPAVSIGIGLSSLHSSPASVHTGSYVIAELVAGAAAGAALRAVRPSEYAKED